MNMKIRMIVLTGLLYLSMISVVAAQDKIKSQDSSDVHRMDFWVGDWNLTWTGKDGTAATGHNHVIRVLGDKVIQENFEALTGPLKGYMGKSWSVYNRRTGQWKQTWVDNSGAYLDFQGERDGGKRIFKRNGMSPQGQPIVQRMIFYDIQKDSFTWDWELSTDGGKTWKLQWRIHYRRAKGLPEMQ